MTIVDRFPLAAFLLSAWLGNAHEAFVLVWNRQRVEDGTPSIFD